MCIRDRGERVELFSIKNAAANTTIDRVLNMVPEVIPVSPRRKKRRKKSAKWP